MANMADMYLDGLIVPRIVLEQESILVRCRRCAWECVTDKAHWEQKVIIHVTCNKGRHSIEVE